jgi:golgin subfamily B member 1
MSDSEKKTSSPRERIHVTRRGSVDIEITPTPPSRNTTTALPRTYTFTQSVNQSLAHSSTDSNTGSATAGLTESRSIASPLTELNDVIDQFRGRVGDARMPTSRTPMTTTPLRSAQKKKYTSPYLSSSKYTDSARKYSTSKGMRDMSLLGATQESDTVVQLLKKRLREKTKSETSLLQEISSTKSKINTLSALLNNEKNAKEEAQRDIMELEDTLSSLRARYEDKSRKEVQLLKDTNRLEIEIKELNSTIEDMSDAESLIKQQLRDARTRLRATEQELFDSQFRVTAKSNQLEVEESSTRELRDVLRDKEGKRVRSEHSNRLVTEALEKRVEKGEQEVSELAAQLRDAEEQVRKLTSAMFETDEEAQKMKQTFERMFKDQVESIEDLQTALASKTAEAAEISSRLDESESRLKLARDELDAKQRAQIESSKQIRLLREQIRGLEDRLSTKQSDFASLTQAHEILKADKKLTEVRINNLEENLADVTTHLSHEKDKSQHLKDLYEECKADYDQLKQGMQASSLQMIDLERQITESSQRENRARIEAAGLKTRVSDLTEKLNREEKESKVLNEKLEIANQDMDDLDRKCKNLLSDLNTTRHQGKLTEQGLVQNLADRDAAIARLRAAIETSENNAAMARESLQRTTEDALKDKSRVERLLSDSNNANAMMKAQLEVLQSRVVDLESDLIKSREKCSKIEAELSASRNTSLELGRVNEQEKMTLESKMKAAVEDLEHTKRELERMRSAFHTLETRNEAGEADRNSLHQRLVILQRECNKQSNLLAENERLEAEQSNKLASQSTSLRILEQRLDDRTEKLSDAQSKVLEYV